jgi:hypothetical protein
MQGFCNQLEKNEVHVERPDPKGLSTLVSAPSSCRTGDVNSCPPDLELGAVTKWLASRC